MKRTREDVLAVVRRERTRSESGRVLYSEKARRAALEHVRQALERGGSVKACGRELGIAYETLRRWLRDAPRCLRAVEIEPIVAGAQLSVTLPGGVRVEGLDVGGIAELCRLLR